MEDPEECRPALLDTLELLAQSSVLANQLWTTRTRQVPPPFASIVHSVAIGGAPGAMPSAFSAVKRCGGCHSWISAFDSMPGPKSMTIDPFACSSTCDGTNHAVSPGPVAMACQTSSGVPGTSVSTAMKRRPLGSFWVGMVTPGFGTSRVRGGR